jgi:hypothetical protein
MRFFLAVLAILVAAPASAQPARTPNAPRTELDAFMEKVLARREQNRLTLQQYVLDEAERFEILGPGRVPLYRLHRDYTWYVRDGLHVRSPVRLDGVTVGDQERTEYEERWARRERKRLADKKEKDEKAAKEAGKAAEPDPADDPQIGPSGATPIPTPRFVSEAYFMEFKFEAGNYYLAGREQLDGHAVLRIEYYPQRMFSDDPKDDPESKEPKPKDDSRRAQRERELEQRIERQMNKTALVTLWVDPAEHQIVKYTFDNVWMDFLPGAWLVRVDEIRASMTMGQPFPGVWLPREMSVNAGITLANGSYDATYGRQFADYRLADVTTKVKIPKAPAWQPPPDAETPDGAGPYASEDQAQEAVAEIRVHGNAYIPDADIIGIAGVTLGQPVTDSLLKEIERRLKDSGRFESVEVRKRYRSLTNTSEVALLLVVHERDGVKTAKDDTGPVTGAWRRFRSAFMFLPILTYADGYGFTYGARFSTLDFLGTGERVSFPLTWGGTRRAAVEVERSFKKGPLTSVQSSFGIWQRENPHYEIDDQRVEWIGRAEKHFGRYVRAGVVGSTSSVDFGDVDDRLWTFGADAVLDSRDDPSFPRNAIFVGAGWTGMHPRGVDERIDRFFTDARGYVGLIGQSVFAARVQYTHDTSPVPIYERLLLGGSSTLRGFRTGTFSGDRLFVSSAEIRVPISSVLSSAKLGVSAFYDASKIYEVGQRFEHAVWRQSAGAGVFLIASILRINVDVAHGFKTGDTRVHLGMGFPF